MITVNQATELVRYRTDGYHNPLAVDVRNPEALSPPEEAFLDPKAVAESIRELRRKRTILRSDNDENAPNVVMARAVLAVIENEEEEQKEKESLFDRALSLSNIALAGARRLALIAVRYAATVARIVGSVVLRIAQVVARGIFMALARVAMLAISNPFVAGALVVLGAGYWAYRRYSDKTDSEQRRKRRVFTTRRVADDLDNSYTGEPGTSVAPASETNAAVGSVTTVGSVGRPSKPAKAAKGVKLSEEVEQEIERAAIRHGRDPATMKAFAFLESRGDPMAYNASSKASGIFQFVPGTARQYGLRNPFDMRANVDAGMRLAGDNIKTMMRLGIVRSPSEVTPGLLYLAHQQGVGGVAKLTVAASRGLRVDQLDRKTQRNVRANYGGDATYVSEFLEANYTKIESYRAVFAKDETTNGVAGAPQIAMATPPPPASQEASAQVQAQARGSQAPVTYGRETEPVLLGKTIAYSRQ